MLMTPLRAPPKIAGPGSTHSLGTSWTSCAVPTLPNGDRPRHILVSWAAYTWINVRYYEVDEFAYQRGIGLCPDMPAYIFDVSGCTNVFFYREDAGTAVDLHLTPLSNQ